MVSIPDREAILGPILAARRAHLERLGLPAHGIEVIMAALAGSPIRGVMGGPVNVVSRAALRKSPLTNETESVTLEFEALFLLEADPDVIDYRTQALAITVHPQEPLPDGGERGHGWQIKPDQLVIERGRVVLRDLMLEQELIDIAKARPWYIHLDADTGDYVCPSAVAACAELGIVYEIRSSKQQGRLRPRGARYLYDFAEHPTSEAAADGIAALVADTPGISIRDVIEEGSLRGWTVDDVLASVAQRIVFCDISRHAPDDHAHARLYRDATTARAYEAAHPPAWAVGGARPARPSTAPDTIYRLGEKRLRLFICVGDEVHFTTEEQAGCPMVVYARTEFERLVAAGVLVPEGGETLVDLARRTAAATWAAASPKARLIAHARWRALEVFRANRQRKRRRQPPLPLPAVDGDVPSTRSCERWEVASARGQVLHGDVLVGLLPAPRPGRPGLRKPAWVEDIIETEITKWYATGVGRGKDALVKRIQKKCEDVSKSERPDRKTILLRLANRDQYQLRRAHDGDKVAYADKPYLSQDPDATPVRGLYPFQRVHYDTTLVDCRVRDPLSGRDLGRPQLGELVDSFSDRSLSHGWGFGGPRVGDLLDALVACAERYGRLPEEIVLDHALSHWAEPLHIFGAANGMHITYRASGQGRFGGGGELMFKRITDELVHHLSGNTRAMKLVRSVTEQTDAQTHAVLSLAELDYLVELFHGLVDDARIVRSTGRTPKATFERGLLEHGRRQSRHVVVDDLFRLQALVPAGTRTAQGVKGIEFENLTYQHECLSCPGVKGKKLEVAGEHRDVSRVWVFIPAHRHVGAWLDARWVEAGCHLLAHLRFVSSHELALATKTVRERMRDDNRNRRVRARAIAEVLEHAEDVEAIALERLRTIAVASVRTTTAPSGASLEPITSRPAPAIDLPAPEVSIADDPIDALKRSIEAGYYAENA